MTPLETHGRPAQARGLTAAGPRITKKQTARVGRYVLVYACGLFFVCFSVVPLIWGVSTALKTTNDQYAYPPKWIPDPVTFEHFISVLHNAAIIRGFVNTVIVATSTTAIALAVGILGGYGFSRFRFPGRNTLLWSVLFTQLFPRVVVIVPFFITLRHLHLMNTLPGLVLVYLMVVFPVSIWLIKGFFDSLPVEIEEAAVVDGCTIPRLLWRIVLPMAKPALVAVAMYSFILAWNEFLFALVFTQGLDKRLLSVALAFFIDENGIRWGDLMAASLLMSIPAVIVFTFSQRLLVRGLSEGALRG
ncbi:MAG TPA: carbohydrate ABC transporter permease [bacterium]|nr:carbohydrate ABC transporter permease [bacterium]